MPRQNRRRILYDGAAYHIINRGHNKQVLFFDKEDFGRFKEIMTKYSKRHHFEIFNYCLMANHFHLILRIAKANDLPVFMKGICQTYASYYKKKYQSVGYLFQNRYKSFLIEKEEYLLECARYVERNPLRAGEVKELSEYLWSSYNHYANGEKDRIISENILYDTFGNTPKKRMKNYVRYVAEPRPYEPLLDKALANLK